jgi:hypothetical protein
MTAPNGAIKFNNSTGHDTQSSGLGPAVAVYGSGASTTAGSATVTGINTAGVSVGDLLWVQSSSGRQFSIIASINVNGTEVTCDDTFANTESGRTWAIGGKRATLDSADSRKFFESDRKSGATVEVEYTGTNYQLSSTLGLASVNASIIITGTGSSKPTIEATNNDIAFSYRSTLVISNINFINTNSTKTASVLAYAIAVASCNIVLFNVNVGDSTNYFWKGFSSGAGASLYFDGGSINNCSNAGIEWRSNLYLDRVNLNGNQIGINLPSPFSGIQSINRCVFRNSVSHGILMHTNYPPFALHFTNNIFYLNGGNDIHQSNSYGPSRIRFINNIFVTSSGYSLTSAGNLNSVVHLVDRNAFYVYGSGTKNNNFPADANEITLTADPFVDAANNDFNINNAAGGGAVLRSTSYTLGG